MSGCANYQLPLTERELQILDLLADGYKLGEISKALGIAYKTAETHKYNAMRKVKVRRAEAAGRTAA